MAIAYNLVQGYINVEDVAGGVMVDEGLGRTTEFVIVE